MTNSEMPTRAAVAAMAKAVERQEKMANLIRGAAGQLVLDDTAGSSKELADECVALGLLKVIDVTFHDGGVTRNRTFVPTPEGERFLFGLASAEMFAEVRYGEYGTRVFPLPGLPGRGNIPEIISIAGHLAIFTRSDRSIEDGSRTTNRRVYRYRPVANSVFEVLPPLSAGREEPGRAAPKADEEEPAAYVNVHVDPERRVTTTISGPDALSRKAEERSHTHRLGRADTIRIVADPAGEEVSETVFRRVPARKDR